MRDLSGYTIFQIAELKQLIEELEAHNADLIAAMNNANLRWKDPMMAMHWIDRYAAGIDDEPQIDRMLEYIEIIADTPALAARMEGTS